jgi:hypothetical protein
LREWLLIAIPLFQARVDRPKVERQAVTVNRCGPPRLLFGLAVLVLPAVVGATGCSTSRGDLGEVRTAFEDITAEELHDARVPTLYEAIERLRPRWLVLRAARRSFEVQTEIVVFQDQSYIGNPGALRRIGTEGVRSVRYVDGATASASLPGLGSRHVSHAIVYSMRPSDR